MALHTGSSKSDTFTFIAGDDYDGSAGKDTLLFVATLDADTTSSTLTSIEILKAGPNATTFPTLFTVNQSDLAAGGSVIGGKNNTDQLVVLGPIADLTSTTLTSIEVLHNDGIQAATFIVDQVDLAKNGIIFASLGNGGGIRAAGSTLNLSHTSVTGVGTLSTQFTGGTTFTVTSPQFGAFSTYTGGASLKDTLIVQTSSIDLSAVTLTDIETLKAGLSTANFFKLDHADLVGMGTAGTIVGGKSLDDLIVLSTDFDLSSTALSSVEQLTAFFTGTASTTFVLDQADLAKNGFINGSTFGADEIQAFGATLDLTSTTLSSVEFVASVFAGGTTFTVNAAELAALSFFGGPSKSDALVVKSATIDLTTTAFASIETLKAGLAVATTFKLLGGDLSAMGTAGSVVGGKALDTLIFAATGIDLTKTSLTSIERLQAGVTDATTFALDQNDLVAKGSVSGHTDATDTIFAFKALDLTSTTLSEIDVLKAATTDDTVMTVTLDQFDTLAISGKGGNDTLALANKLFDLTGTIGLTSIEELKAGLATATTFKLDLADLAGVTSITGGKGVDTLIVKDISFNLANKTLSSVEKLQAGVTDGTSFVLNQGHLAAKGSVIGHAGVTDEIKVSLASLDLTSTTLTSIEMLATQAPMNTHMTVNQAQFDSLTIIDGGGAFFDTLTVVGTKIDLTDSAAVFLIDALEAGMAKATTFTMTDGDLSGFSAISGNAGKDTLIVTGTQFNLDFADVTSVEILKAGNKGTDGTLFTVDQADLATGGSVIGGAGEDTLKATESHMDLRFTTLTSIEHLLGFAAFGNTMIDLDQGDLKGLKDITGAGIFSDTLAVAGTSVDLTSIGLSSIEILQANSPLLPTTFKLDLADLANNGSIIGTGAVTGPRDTLIILGTDFDLSHTALSSVEILKGGSSLATTFTVNQDDLSAGGDVIGGKGIDTLSGVGTTLDLSSTTLSGVEIITSKQAGAVDTKYTIGAGEGGARVELGAAGKDDTIIFTADYAVSDVSSIAKILAHTVTIGASFEAGASGDVVDVSQIDHGAAAFLGNSAFGSGFTLKQALDSAASADGAVNSKITAVQFGGDTYVLVNNSASSILAANDAVIKLVGTHTLVSGNIDL